MTESFENPRLAFTIPHSVSTSIKSKLSSDVNFVWIKRKISPKQHQKIINLGQVGLQTKKQMAGMEREFQTESLQAQEAVEKELQKANELNNKLKKELEASKLNMI